MSAFPGRQTGSRARLLEFFRHVKRCPPKSSAPTTSAASSARTPHAEPSCATSAARSARSARARRADIRRSAATAGSPGPSWSRALDRRPARRRRRRRSTSAWRPTPVAYFAAHHLGCGSCVAVSGSHNPPEYNGLKMVVGRRHALRRRHPGAAHSGSRQGELTAGTGKRSEREHARRLRRAHRRRRQARAADAHRDRLRQRRRRHAGAALVSARSAARSTELYCEVDGTLPEPPSRSVAARRTSPS